MKRIIAGSLKNLNGDPATLASAQINKITQLR